jgi:hypothetical protein
LPEETVISKSLLAGKEQIGLALALLAIVIIACPFVSQVIAGQKGNPTMFLSMIDLALGLILLIMGIAIFTSKTHSLD